MPTPILLAIAYLLVNLVFMLWIELGRANGYPPTPRVAWLSAFLRFGPPLAGLVYLVTISGDWLFFVFVIVFFGTAFWLMDGLLSDATPRRGSEPMRRGWDDRNANSRVNRDRDSAT
jgi:hypothetical protein